MRKIMLIVALLFVVLLSIGCDISLPSTNSGINGNQTSEEKYTIWKDSNDAKDYNSDSIIDEKDYKIYLDLVAWLDSDDAIDYNGDRKINYDDFKINESYKEWKKTDEAQDLNGDKKIDFDDFDKYQTFLTWKNGTDAIDLNEDTIINVDDYLIFNGAEYQSYVAWKNSKDALDYNEDNIIDNADYKVYLAFVAWLDTDVAADLNCDRVINYNDYIISLNPSISELEKWLLSENAADLNGDGKVDKNDYQLSLIMGTYTFSSFGYSGEGVARLTFDNSNFSVEDFVEKKDQFQLKFTTSGIGLILSDSIKNELNPDDVTYLMELCSRINYEFLTDTVFAIDCSFEYFETTIPLSFYVKIENGLLSSTFSFSAYNPNLNKTLTFAFNFTLQKVANEQ